MANEISCSCGKKYAAKPELAGKRVRCPACRGEFVVPAPDQAPPVAAVVAADEDDTYSFQEHSFQEQSPDEASEDYAMQEPDVPYNPHSMVLGNDYIASNPGQFQVNFLKYWMSYPLWPTIWMVGLAASLVFAVGVHYVLSAVVIFFAAVNIYYWILIHEQFRHGCVCPALLLSEDDGLVAVYDDLSMRGRPYLVVKIVREPMHRMSGGPFETGDRLAAVAVYRGKPESSGRWANFYPKTVNCVTMSRKKIDRVMRGISEQEWDNLLAAVAQLERPYRPGLYPVNIRAR